MREAAAGASGSARPRGPAARPRVALVVVLVVSGLVWLAGLFSVPPIDRDEPRYAQATRQMLETGDFVDIRFQDEARHVKPAGIYWLQAAAATLSGEGAGAPVGIYRLVSVAGALAGVALTWWALSAFLAPPAALAATALVAATVLLGVEARLAKTDAVLFAAVMAAQGALARLWLASRSPGGATPGPAGADGDAPTGAGFGTAMLFWAAIGTSIMIKGPVGPMIAGLTVAALVVADRSLALVRALRPLPGLLLAAAIAGPWLAAIGLRSDGAFFAASLGEDWWGKLLSGQQKHWAPPGAHILVLLATAWPLIPFVVRAAPSIWRDRTAPAIIFAAAWAIPAWLVFEAAPTKLPHYLLPLVPALALAAVAAWASPAGAPGRGWRIAAAVLMLLVPGGLAAAAVAVPLLLGDLPSFVGAGLVAAAVVPAAFAARRLSVVAGRSATLPALAAAVLLQLGLIGFVLPELRMAFPAPRTVEAARALAGCAPVRIVSVGFREPSVVFLGGTDTLLADPEAAVARLAAAACAVAIVEARWRDDFLAAARSAGVAVVLRGREDGFNINSGRFVSLGLYMADRP